MKTSKKKHFTTNRSIYTSHRHFDVLWSFILYILQRFVLFLKHSHYAYTPPYIHKTLPTLGNEKEQKQTEFYKKSSGNLIFLQATKNLKIIYFTCLTGRVLQNKVTPLKTVSSCKKSENFYKRFWRQTYKCTNGKTDKQKNR